MRSDSRSKKCSCGHVFGNPFLLFIHLASTLLVNWDKAGRIWGPSTSSRWNIEEDPLLTLDGFKTCPFVAGQDLLPVGVEVGNVILMRFGLLFEFVLQILNL